MNVQSRLSFLDMILRVLRLEVPYTIFTLQTSFKPLLLGGGGGSKIRCRDEVESKEENFLKTYVLITSKNSPSGYFLGKAGGFSCSFEVLHGSRDKICCNFLYKKTGVF